MNLKAILFLIPALIAATAITFAASDHTLDSQTELVAFVGGDGDGDGGKGPGGKGETFDCIPHCVQNCTTYTCHFIARGSCGKGVSNYSQKCQVAIGGLLTTCDTKPDAGPCVKIYRNPCVQYVDQVEQLPKCTDEITGCGAKTKCD